MAAKRIDQKLHPACFDFDGLRRFADQDARGGFQTFRRTNRRVVALDHAFHPGDFRQGCRDLLFVEIHGKRQRLEHDGLSIPVGDHAGQPVAFAPDHAPQIAAATRPLAVFDRLGDPPPEKVGIQILPPPGIPSHHNLRAGIINANPEQMVAPVFDRDDLAVFRIAERFQDLGRINPVVAVKDARPRTNNDAAHSAVSRAREPG